MTKPHVIRCAEIWGGVGERDADVCSRGIEASVWSSSADGVTGGDIHYLSVCGADALTRMVVADVVGHGETVSEVSSRLYASLLERMNEPDGTTILGDMNHVALDVGLRAMTTATVLGYYTADAVLRVAFAGQREILVRRRREAAWAPFESDAPDDGVTNLPLSVDEDSRYVPLSTGLEPGDRIALFSDGVLEAPDADGVLFGRDALLRALDEAGDRALAEAKHAVIDALTAHTGGPLVHDDVTLLLAEVR